MYLVYGKLFVVKQMLSLWHKVLKDKFTQKLKFSDYLLTLMERRVKFVVHKIFLEHHRRTALQYAPKQMLMWLGKKSQKVKKSKKKTARKHIMSYSNSF